MEHTRRGLLTATAGIASAGALAGCLGGLAGDSGDGSTAQATFFVFGDVAAEVAGETASTNLLVPVGQHGHGWEPGPRVREDVYSAELLLHGMEGFQPWVDDIRGDLEGDDGDVETVDVSAGVDLLEAGHVAEGGHDEESGEHGHEEETADHDEADDGHDHSEGMDPHFWMDPTRVKEAVTTVREALSGVDSDGADTYADNAAAYRERLDDLDDRFASAVAAGEKDVLLVAGHDAFQYFGDRYGVEIRALTDVSPDDRPTARDITAAQEIIDEHDLSYVCADPLESQEAAEQLVAETDAEAVLPLTSLPGLKTAWADDDWGYVEVMANVNLPTIERALDA